MEITTTPIEGLLIIQPKVFEDARGYFVETFNVEKLKALGVELPAFVQDNESKSAKGVLRGLHFQKPPCAQGKLVRVISGAVYDVAVDIRKDSKTYGQHFGIRLDEKNKTQFWIPPGFAHGFVTLEENTVFAYKCTGCYNSASEGGLLWNSPELGIDWKIENPLLSDKDKVYPTLKDFVSPF